MLEKRGNINCSGVYQIKNFAGKVLYIGCSSECGNAYSRHNSNLKNGNYAYTNKNDLQVLFNTEDLIFSVLEECTEDKLTEVETKYINLYKDTIVNKDTKGKRRTSKTTEQETERRRMANIGEKNPHCNKLCVEDILNIRQMLKDGIKQAIIAKKYNCSQTLIYNIKHQLRWASVSIS